MSINPHFSVHNSNNRQFPTALGTIAENPWIKLIYEWRMLMKVKDIMSTKIVSVSPEESATVAARLLSRYNIGAMPVCAKNGKLRGMITDRDIVLRCVASDEDPTHVKVSDIMTRRVISIAGEESVEAATALMAREQIRRLPVEENGKVIGMVSIGDFAKIPSCKMEAGQALSEISMNTRHL